ncbi:hypothetical protein M8C21_033690 [Ambrosia artemisiifolia]|uniref:Uncharacterized protein n=1 Tax=Ambrosia artemisiifolia TaxID=4212 RepID=A0AAD5GD57_AMBAR|nr:hypothetical protein M8C21_033690 [Ambrosia artemisiifolia]
MLMPQKPFNRKPLSRIFEEQNISNNHQGKFYLLYELDAEIGHKELDVSMSGSGKCRQHLLSVFWFSLVSARMQLMVLSKSLLLVCKLLNIDIYNRNEMAQLPEGLTELLEHEKLPIPLDQEMVEAAMETLSKKLPSGVKQISKKAKDIARKGYKPAKADKSVLVKKLKMWIFTERGRPSKNVGDDNATTVTKELKCYVRVSVGKPGKIDALMDCINRLILK